MTDLGGYKPPSYPDLTTDKNANNFDYSLLEDIQSTTENCEEPSPMTFAPNKVNEMTGIFRHPPRTTVPNNVIF